MISPEFRIACFVAGVLFLILAFIAMRGGGFIASCPCDERMEVLERNQHATNAMINALREHVGMDEVPVEI